MPREDRRPVVFFGLVEVAGYYANLARGMAELGVECVYCDLSCHAFGYDAPQARAWPVRLARWIVRAAARAKLGNGRLRTTVEFLPLLFARGIVLAWALPRCDAFVLGYRSTFLWYLEFPLLRLLHKKLVCVFHGSDSRPPYVDGPFVEGAGLSDPRRYAREALRVKREIRTIERYADQIVSHPPMALLQTRPFVAGLHIGIPFAAPADATPAADGGALPGQPPGTAVRVLHAPSVRAVKGTAQIRQAVAELQQEGLLIDYIEVSGRPHAAVMREMARCDFVVDQLYSDTPLAGFATEAAFHAKPAVVGGYYVDQLQRDYPRSAIPPSLYCHPQHMKQAIRRLATDGAYRRELGHRAREYVAANWAPEVVAGRYLRIIGGQVPAEWVYEPMRACYMLGAGMSESMVKQVVGRLVATHGVGALQLADKPHLERALCEFARQ